MTGTVTGTLSETGPADHLVRIANVDIVFGDRAKEALPLIDQGASREDIRQETDQILGVANASVDVREGEILVLMGLSGSGKSTLLRAVNGLAPVIRGHVEVRCNETMVNPYDCDRQTLRRLRANHVSMVFQQFALLPWRTVSENVGFGLELSGMPKSRRKQTIEENLELVGLSEWAPRKVGELSGGMQQRVGLARAFATGAPILLMDEPFSALDPLIRSRLQDELLAFQTRLKKTILFVSHDLDEAFKIGNRIAIMEGGRIVQCGTPQEIVINPANDYVADFVAHMNPLGVLRAEDVMRPADHRQSRETSPTLAGSASPATPLKKVMDLLQQHEGDVAVVRNGAIIGSISARDIVVGLRRHSR